MVPAGIEFVLNHIYNKSCECCFHRAFTTFSLGNRKVGMQTIILFDIMLCHVAVMRRKLWREVELSLRAMQFVTRWLRCEVSCAVRANSGESRVFKHCSTTSCGYLCRCNCLLHAVEPCHAIDLGWLIMGDWSLKCRDGLKLCPGECNSWQRGICLEFWWVSVFGNPVCAIAKAEEFPEQFSALFAWWAFGGNHFKLIWHAPWCGLASLLWQQGVNKKMSRRNDDKPTKWFQGATYGYTWFKNVQDLSLSDSPKGSFWVFL